jgi:hypothetical protein
VGVKVNGAGHAKSAGLFENRLGMIHVLDPGSLVMAVASQGNRMNIN